MFVAVVGVGAVAGVVAAARSHDNYSDHSNYHDHSNYSDAEILMEIKTLESQLKDCDSKLKRVNNTNSDEFLEKFIDFINKYNKEDPDFKSIISEELSNDSDSDIENLANTFNVIREYIKAKIEEEQKLLEYFDNLINRINEVTLTKK